MNNKVQICHKCGKGFHRKFLFRQHVDFCQNGKLNFQCSECGNAFEFRSRLNNHIKNCHGEKKHICGVCNYTTAYRSQLKVHMNTHTKENTFMCDSCPQVFTHQSALCSHKKLHAGLGQTECPECGKTVSKKNLRTHIVSRHSEKNTKYEKGFSKEIKSKAVALAKEVGTLEASKMLDLKYTALKKWRSGYIRKKTSVAKVKVRKDYRKNVYTNEYKQQVATFIRENSMEAACQMYNISDGTLRRWDKLYNNCVRCKECDISFPYRTELVRHMQRKHKYSEQEALNSCDEEFKQRDKEFKQRHEEIIKLKFKEINQQLSNKIDGWKKEKREFKQEKTDVTEEVKGQYDSKCKDNKCETNNEHNEIEEDSQEPNDLLYQYNDKDDTTVRSDQKEDKLESLLDETKNDRFEILEEKPGSIECNFQKQLPNIFWNYYLSSSIHLCALVLVSLFCLQEKKTSEVCNKRKFVTVKKKRNNRKKRAKDLDRKSGLFCRYCKKQFKNETSAIHHEKMLHEGLFTVNCEFCGTQFKEDFRLKEHQERTHWKELEDRTGVPGEKFSCTPCSRYWRVKRDLERHVRIAHGPKLPSQASHTCQYCGKSFARLQNQKRHEVKMHTNKNVNVKKEELPCPHCNVKYQVKGHLLRHIKNFHEESDAKAEPLACTQCGRKYTRMKQLQDHRRVHSKAYLEAKSICNICGKEFRCTASLKSHVDIIHNGLRNYPCDICGKLFTRYNTLKAHRKIHDDIKPFECINCNSAYREKRNLVNHIKKKHPQTEMKSLRAH